MRQRVAHGAAIEAATPTEVAQIVAEQLDRRRGVDFHREKGTVNLDATGAGQSSVNVPKQYHWLLERVTIGGAGAVSALVVIFDNSPNSDADMLEVIQLGTAGRYSDGFSNNLWAPAGGKLIITVVSGVANGQVTFNFQVKLLATE